MFDKIEVNANNQTAALMVLKEYYKKGIKVQVSFDSKLCPIVKLDFNNKLEKLNKELNVR